MRFAHSKNEVTMNGITKKKITIIGNSVALRVRPSIQLELDESYVYGYLLESELNKFDGNSLAWTVDNLGLSRLLIKEVYDNSDEYLRSFSDVYIFNIGCVDAPNREIPLWFSDIVFKRKYKIFHSVINTLYISVIKKYLRLPLVALRGHKPWVSETEFKFYFNEVLEMFCKQTSAKIIVMGINAGNQRIENMLPGTMANYRLYSEILKKICLKNQVDFIDVSDLSSENYFPDGVHYNDKGHAEISLRLVKSIRGGGRE